ncbi:UDP-N-acetylglucosamine 2-epimerase [Rivibacter subsaxonicus]|uniref:Type II secretory pathway predicted ATPase ExeA n=1 Tax=Rivibacter subsaxonicus TaxID=457575 RepID=A0A4Q7VVT9_9BURK|nr:UDP-N-acetylglucosamine 2-epimerase [Rivibacter subsaxonicus]RZU00771.1 type II secretory pathway predicted ATPase ExeA [Rivibacter subsaxonicus]
MYEAQFALSGAPFRISPDPAFYFDGRAHRKALEVLRQALAADSGFAVLGGEVGAGKTTIVRKLLQERSPELGPIVQLCSTQLSADELLCSAGIGLGVIEAKAGADAARRGLEELFEALAAQGRRALLVVDEAQHLRPDALAALRALAGRRPQAPSAFQALLVGQGSLHHLLAAGLPGASPSKLGVMHQLGPLQQDETTAYIRHRLSCVGWSGQPGLAADAADEVFRSSGGVPRRINVLFSRLLLACALESRSSIDAALVSRVAAELQAELTGLDMVSAPQAPRPRKRTRALAAEALPLVRYTRARTSSPPAWPQTAPKATAGPLWCAVASADDYVLAAPLLRALRGRAGLPPARLLHLGAKAAMTLHAGLFADVDRVEKHIDLGAEAAPGDDAALDIAELARRFAAAAERHEPSGLIVFGGHEPGVVACVESARQLGVPVIGIGTVGFDSGASAGGVHAESAPGPGEFADLHFAPDSAATVELRLRGVAPSRVVCVGSLRVDAVRLALQANGVDWAESAAGGRRGAAFGVQPGFGLVAMHDLASLNDAHAFIERVAILREISRDIAMLWPIDRRLARRLVELDLQRAIDKERIVCMPMLGYPAFIELLRTARCVLTDSVAVEQAARVLGTASARLAVPPSSARGRSPSSSSLYRATRDIWNLLFNGGSAADLPPLWDGKSAERIAADLARRPLSGRHLLLQPTGASGQGLSAQGVPVAVGNEATHGHA